MLVGNFQKPLKDTKSILKGRGLMIFEPLRETSDHMLINISYYEHKFWTVDTLLLANFFHLIIKQEAMGCFDILKDTKEC